MLVCYVYPYLYGTSEDMTSSVHVMGSGQQDSRQEQVRFNYMMTL